jgi:ATPase family associated with various cellular activities (AAA)
MTADLCMRPWWKNLDITVDLYSVADYAAHFMAQRELEERSSSHIVRKLYKLSATIPEAISRLESALSKVGCNLRYTSERMSIFISDDAYLCIGRRETSMKYIDVTLVAKDTSPIHKIVQDGCHQDEILRNCTYLLMSSHGSTHFERVETPSVNLIEDNYSPEVMLGLSKVKEMVSAKNPNGRLAIMSGPPGTGKTHLIRGLMGSMNAAFVIVSSHNISGTMDPSYLSALVDLKNETSDPIVFILEDADDALAPREDTDQSLIAGLLNLADGLIGSIVDVRIIATTNRAHQEFDQAIIRPGRLGAHIDVGLLSQQAAAAVYKRLTSEDVDFYEPMSLASIYQCAFNTTWAKVPESKRKLGF